VLIGGFGAAEMAHLRAWIRRSTLGQRNVPTRRGKRTDDDGSPPAARRSTAAGSQIITSAAGPPQPFTGEVEFIPDHAVVLGASHAHGPAAQCVIDFAVSVRSVPVMDSNANVPGTQTAALARVEIDSAATPTHLDPMFDALTEVTVFASACADASPLLAAASACTVLQTGSGKPGDDKLTFGARGGAKLPARIVDMKVDCTL
jgi:hypothetical protein